MSHHGDHSVHREHVLEETVVALRAERTTDRERIRSLETDRAHLAARCLNLALQLRIAGVSVVDDPGAQQVVPTLRSVADAAWHGTGLEPAHAAPSGTEPVLDKWIAGPRG